jgi:RalA-binding protein 1
MLSAHAGAENPALNALEQSVSERNLLSSQNAQLWKLIEKSRGLYTESQKNLERVRMERDAYKARLLMLGENPDAIARGHKEREKQLKPSASSNGMRQSSDKPSSQSSGSARPTRHQSADTGTWPCIRAGASFWIGLLTSQWLGLVDTLTPQWQPTSRAPIVTVSHSSLEALDVSITPPTPSVPHTRQQPSTRPLNISKGDDRPSASAPASQSTSPSANFPPSSVFSSSSSNASPLEMSGSSSQSSIPFLTRPQAANRESRITLPEEAKQYISSVMDSPANSLLALEPGRSHSRGQSPASSSVHNLPDSRDSATDKSSTRRDLSDGEFLDLEDSDSLYDSAADHSLTSPSHDSRSPDDVRQPRLAVPPAADDFPLPPGMVNASNGDPKSGTPQAIPAIQRTRKADGPDSPTTPTPVAYGSRSSVMSVYQSLIPEQDSQVQFRALPLLPHDLPYTHVTVTNSSIRPNDRGKDVLSFVVMVDPGNQKESYLIEKLYSDVLGLDQRIRARYGKSIHKKIPHLPDGKLWRDHAPSKVDQRKVWLPFCVCAKY